MDGLDDFGIQPPFFFLGVSCVEGPSSRWQELGDGIKWELSLTHSAIEVQPMPIIEIENLVKSYRVFQKREGFKAAIRGLFDREYRDVQAVQGIDLQVEQGEFVAFLGPNGAGKTTTLKLLSGLSIRRPVLQGLWATFRGAQQ